MVLQKACPTKDAKTGVYYFRQETPADLVAIVGKKEVDLSRISPLCVLVGTTWR